MHRAADKGIGSSSQETAEVTAAAAAAAVAARWMLRLARLKMRPSIMFLSTAQLDVRSPGLGHARSRLQCAVPKWASCDPILPSLRMKGGTGAGTHRCPGTELSEAGTEGLSVHQVGVSRLDLQHPSLALRGRPR